MPTHLASRNRILKENGLSPCKTDAERNIREVEYAPVPPPINSQAQPARNCFIWLGVLNEGGYGVRQFNHKRELAPTGHYYTGAAITLPLHMDTGPAEQLLHHFIRDLVQELTELDCSVT